jgi:hypothetical protein
MKNSTNKPLVDFVKASLPHVNREDYELKSVKTWAYTWPYKENFNGEMTIVIQEKRDYEPWMDKTLRHSHWYQEKSYDDRPIRDHSLIIIERRKSRRHKHTWEVKNSWVHWFKVFEKTNRAEDQLLFLK